MPPPRPCVAVYQASKVNLGGVSPIHTDGFAPQPLCEYAPRWQICNLGIGKICEVILRS